MQFPIDLSNTKESLYLCTWNGDEIIEIHTLESLRREYGETNLFDEDEFCHLFEMPFEEYVKRMGNGDHHIFDNMRIDCIKSFIDI